jgi:protein-S-isoprenylcysteine O-methyltransferase Ste14
LPLRAIGLAFGVATQVLFLVTVCFLFKFLRDGSRTEASNWLAVDTLLASQFAIVHSWLLLPRIRSKISQAMPPHFYGSVFAVATCAGLLLTFAYWRTSSAVIWDVTGLGGVVISAGFYASWLMLFYSLKLTGFGYQTGLTQWLFWVRRQSLPRRAFEERGSYRWLRHPVYLSFLGLIWFTPRMTFDHAVLTALWTSYILVGSYLKDQRLLFYLGDQYRDYASRVPGYPGVPFGPLAKWQTAEMPCTSVSAGEDKALVPAA